jgi:hypothetical protein
MLTIRGPLPALLFSMYVFLAIVPLDLRSLQACSNRKHTIEFCFVVGSDPRSNGRNDQVLTSFAETNCSGRRAAFRSAVLVSRSYSACAILVSSSDGVFRDWLVCAILLRCAVLILAVLMRLTGS